MKENITPNPDQLNGLGRDNLLKSFYMLLTNGLLGSSLVGAQLDVINSGKKYEKPIRIARN